MQLVYFYDDGTKRAVIFVNASNSVRLSTAATVLLFSTLDHIAGYSVDVVLDAWQSQQQISKRIISAHLKLDICYSSVKQNKMGLYIS